MSSNPIAAAGRRRQREQRFGESPACARCGMTEMDALVSMKRRLLEAHHVCGRANDESLTVPVCRNCHAMLTEGQRSAGVSFDPPPTLLHQLAAALLSLFVMLHDLSERGMAWAHALVELAADLDASYPEWRALPSARAIGAAT